MKIRRPSTQHDAQALLDFGDRIVDGDTTPPTSDLESTFLKVQHAMRANHPVPDTMPAHLRMRAWENIMQDSAAIPTGNQRHLRAFPSVVLPRMAWTGVANLALAVLVVVAGFGAWRVFDSGSGSGGTDPAPSGGHYAQAPMTPAPAATASDEVVVEPISACDLSEDIPLVPDVTSVELDGSVLTITPRNQGVSDPTGTLMLHCAAEPEPIQLAGRVLDATAGPSPGVVHLSLLPEGTTDPQDQVSAYLDVATGRTITFANSPAGIETRNDGSSIPGSPWVIGRDQANPTQLLLAYLGTMQAWPLGDIAGIDLGEDALWIGAAADNTTVLGILEPDTGTGEGGTLRALDPDSAVPGLMVIDNDADNILFIDLPESLKYVRDIWPSPDGSAIALSVYDDPTQSADALSYAIISASDGTMLAQSRAIWDPGDATALWIQDGEAITFTDGDTVQVLRAEKGAQPKVVLETGQEIATLRTTYDPDTIVASIRKDHGSDADKVFSVNVTTGETHEFDGLEIGDIQSQVITQADVLLMYDFVTPESPITVAAYDPVSGERIEDLGQLPSPHSAGNLVIGRNLFTSSEEQSTTVYSVGWQNLLVVQVVDGSSIIHRVAPPTEGSGAADAILSPDGQTVSVVSIADDSRARWLLDISDPGADWVNIPNEAVSSDPGVIKFVQGIK